MERAILADVGAEFMACEFRTLVRHQQVWPSIVFDPQMCKCIAGRFASGVRYFACHLISSAPAHHVHQHLIEALVFELDEVCANRLIKSQTPW